MPTLMTDTTRKSWSSRSPIALYVKRKDNGVEEILSWKISQVRYFDPTFGGAVVDGQRNVIWSTISLTPFAFLDGPRNYSPIVSLIRFQKKIGIDWETDYDPLHSAVVANVSMPTTDGALFCLDRPAQVRDDPPDSPVTVLTPTSGQFRGTIGYGDSNRRGLNAAMSFYYDYKQGALEYLAAQTGYNTNCCGINIQYRRLNFGGADERKSWGRLESPTSVRRHMKRPGTAVLTHVEQPRSRISRRYVVAANPVFCAYRRTALLCYTAGSKVWAKSVLVM
jgi:hypothetical protein